MKEYERKVRKTKERRKDREEKEKTGGEKGK
jgi:hypothetical protein